MGSFIVKNKSSHEENEVFYDDRGVIYKIVKFCNIWNQDLTVDLRDFSLGSPIKFAKLQERAFQELNAERDFAAEYSDEGVA